MQINTGVSNKLGHDVGKWMGFESPVLRSEIEKRSSKKDSNLY
jgi:hypothetical protein